MIVLNTSKSTQQEATSDCSSSTERAPTTQDRMLWHAFDSFGKDFAELQMHCHQLDDVEESILSEIYSSLHARR